jgi:transcriptional regulator with XRE-family HTH domain
VQLQLQCHWLDGLTVLGRVGGMPKVKTRFKEGPPRHFIREWRKFRDLTLERLAERVGVTHGAIAQLERGEVAYTQSMLEALADGLNCSPADLIGRPPEKEYGIRPDLQRLVELAEGAKPDEVRQIEGFAEYVTRKAS